MKKIKQEIADMITVSKIKGGEPGILINQKKDCIDLEIESIPELVVELVSHISESEKQNLISKIYDDK